MARHSLDGLRSARWTSGGIGNVALPVPRPRFRCLSACRGRWPLEGEKPAAKGTFPRLYPMAQHRRGWARLRVAHNPQDDMAVGVGSRRKHGGKLILAQLFG